MNQNDREERMTAIVAYLQKRGYGVDDISAIVAFLLPTQQLTSIRKNVIKPEDEETLFALAGLD